MSHLVKEDESGSGHQQESKRRGETLLAVVRVGRGGRLGLARSAGRGGGEGY